MIERPIESPIPMPLDLVVKGFRGDEQEELREASERICAETISLGVSLAVTCCACGETQDIRNANTTKRIRLVHYWSPSGQSCLAREEKFTGLSTAPAYFKHKAS
jgi:hypothetical protein